MRVVKWTTSFSPAKESSMAPVWITFPFLPNHLSNGSRPSHPRVCIEYDCLKPPPDQIYVHLREKKSGLNEGRFWQRVSFERIPSYCTHCHTLGHAMSACKLFTENLKFKGKKAEEGKSKSEKNEKTNERRENSNNGKGSVLGKENLQPLEKQSENQATFEFAPYLTKNWEIGNGMRGKGGDALRDGNYVKGEASNIPVKNIFSSPAESLGPGMEEVETQNLSKKSMLRETVKRNHPGKLNTTQVCASNREASIPGSNTTDANECALLEFEKKKDATSKNIGETCFTDPVDKSNQTTLLSEQGQAVVSVDGVAQGKSTEGGRICAVSVAPGDSHRVWTATSVQNRGVNVLPGPSRVSPLTQNNALKAIIGPSIHLSDTLILDSAQLSALKVNLPVAQNDVVPESKSQDQEGIVSSSKESCAESDVIDNWLLSERKDALAEKRMTAASSPALGSHQHDDSVPKIQNRKGVGSSSWDAEDDYLLQQLESSPPVTRSRALQLAREKNKRKSG